MNVQRPLLVLWVNRLTFECFTFFERVHYEINRYTDISTAISVEITYSKHDPIKRYRL